VVGLSISVSETVKSVGKSDVSGEPEGGGSQNGGDKELVLQGGGDGSKGL